MAIHQYLIVSVLILTVSSEYVSTNQCKNASPECLKESLQSALPIFVNGDTRIGTELMDPFFINKLELDLPGNLKIEFKQGISKGLRKCIIETARLADNKLELQLRCNLTIKGNYKCSGSLLMFTIDGDGYSVIKCRDIRIKFEGKIGYTVAEDGKKHLEIKSYQTQHSYDGQVHFRLTNLIKGNPQISNLIVEFMNQNWRLVAEEFGKPIVDFGISSVLKNLKKLFKAVPLDDLIEAS